jgi:hypothetical protein
VFGDRVEAGRVGPTFVNVGFGTMDRHKATSPEDIEALLLLRETMAEKDIA